MKENNKAIKKAKEVLEQISQDEHERYLAELREKYIMDQKAIADAGYDKGLVRGKEIGEKKEKIKIAKKLKNMNIEIKQIEEATGLTKEEIESL